MKEIAMDQHDFTLYRDSTNPDKFFFLHIVHFESGSISGAVVTRGEDDMFDDEDEAIRAMKIVAEDEDFPFFAIDDYEDLISDHDAQFVAEYNTGFRKL
jgi:hypothetical protein